jgi:hypothetical protein
VWNERNARIFERKESTPMHLLQKIKEKAGLWAMVEAKHISNLLLHM